MANWGWMYIAHCNTVFWQVCPALLCFLESVWLSYFSCLLPVCPSQNPASRTAPGLLWSPKSGRSAKLNNYMTQAEEKDLPAGCWPRTATGNKIGNKQHLGNLCFAHQVCWLWSCYWLHTVTFLKWQNPLLQQWNATWMCLEGISPGKNVSWAEIHPFYCKNATTASTLPLNQQYSIYHLLCLPLLRRRNELESEVLTLQNHTWIIPQNLVLIYDFQTWLEMLSYRNRKKFSKYLI